MAVLLQQCRGRCGGRGWRGQRRETAVVGLECFVCVV